MCRAYIDFDFDFGGDLITRNKQVQLMLNPCLFMGEIFYHFWCILLALPTTTTTKAIKDIVFRFIIEYNSSSLRDFYWPILANNNSSIYFYNSSMYTNKVNQ